MQRGQTNMLQAVHAFNTFLRAFLNIVCLYKLRC